MNGKHQERDGLLVMQASAETGVSYALGADKLVDGNPAFVSWDIEKTDDGKIVSGIWEASPGAWRSAKGTDWEFCHLIEGVVDLTEDGKTTIRLKAGDVFVMRLGFIGTWRVIETVRKSFVIYSA